MKVAINGFGRIGRQTMRIILENKASLEVVAINDLTDTKTLAHLFEFDSTYGRFKGEVEVIGEDKIKINGKTITIYAEPDPENLPWKKLEVDLVLECSGHFRTHEKASKHLKAGAKKVIISAPGKGDKPMDATIVMGVNEDIYDPQNDHIISNASCTTNCMAPVIKVINDNFKIVRGFMTTIHSVTNDQRILDLPHSDLRRARSCIQSMIPTTTGATKAVGLVLPELKGKFMGMAVRVPLPTVSLVDMSIQVEKDTTIEAVNAAFHEREKEIPHILKAEKKLLVSKDMQGECHSAIVDLASTEVLDKKFVKVMAWYDNEWGYSCRLVDLAEYIAKK